jgi:lipopolysaccharide transport system ATP-binding protein
MKPIIKIENLSKQYRLGTIGTGTLSHDLKRWYYRVRGKEDPYLKIGVTPVQRSAIGSQQSTISELETRNPKPRTKNQEPRTKNPEPGTRNQEPETRNPKPETRNQEPGTRNPKRETEYVWALRDINLEVLPGEVLGIIGKNGAGKSTLLKILSKVTGPTTGRIDYNGRIGSLLEVGTGFHQELTGRENIFLNGAILGMTKAEIRKKLDEIIDFSGVEKYIDTPVKRYSSGMMVRLGFAVAAHLEPEILVVDEVLAVGDAEFQKKAIGKMQDVSRNEGRTVLFVSHNMQAVRNLCHTCILLADGEIRRTGETTEVVDHYLFDNAETVKDSSFVKINDKHRLIPVSRELEILSVERKNPYLIDVTTPLKFKLLVKKNTNIKTAQVMALIDDVANGGLRVGLTFSEILELPPDSDFFEVIITLSNHNLTRGKYIMDFWIGIGDVISAVKYYDAVYDTLTFEVEQYKGKYINTWYNYWGNSCYSDATFRVQTI